MLEASGVSFLKEYANVLEVPMVFFKNVEDFRGSRFFLKNMEEFFCTIVFCV